MIARDILLAELTGGHVHVAHESRTGKGGHNVEPRAGQAKKKGIPVTTEVCPPPLRSDRRRN